MSAVTEGAKLYTGAIISVAAGKALPKEFIETVVGKNKSCIGVTFTVPENKEVIPATDPRGPDANQFEGARNAYPNSPINFFLGNANKGAEFKKEDIQPFVMLTEGKTSEGKDKPTVCVMLDGDFTPYIKDTGHSEHYNFAHEFLKPKIEKLSKLVNGDLDKLAEALNDPDDIFARDIPSGMVLFILGNGKNIVLKKNYETFKETSFGFVSDTYGWSEQQQAPAPQAAVPPPPQGLLDKLRGQFKAWFKELTLLFFPPPPAMDTSVKAPAPIAEDKGTPYIEISCPKAINGKKLIAAWYITNTLEGLAPKKYFERPVAKCKVPTGWKGEIKYLKVVKSFSEMPAPAPVVPPPPAPAPVQEPAAEPGQQTDDGDASNGDFEHPVMDPAERDTLTTKVLKFQDENKDFVQDPRSMQEWTEKRETFAEAMGLTDAPDFTPEFLEDMFENHPIAFWTWSMDMWTKARIAEARVAELEARIGQLDQPAPPQAQPQPVAGVVPPPSRLRKSA